MQTPLLVRPHNGQPAAEILHEDWVQAVDLTTQEWGSDSEVSDDLRDREDDIVRRMRWGVDWLYIDGLFALQDTVDPSMALRLLVSVGLLSQSLMRTKQLPPSGKLPPVVLCSTRAVAKDRRRRRKPWDSKSYAYVASSFPMLLPRRCGK